MRREKPDPLHLAIWAAANLRFDSRCEWEARYLWNHWSDYAESVGARHGTPRSFSNALRQLGAPWKRGFECRDLGIFRPRTRLHRGLRLELPILSAELPIEAAIARCERYGM